MKKKDELQDLDLDMMNLIEPHRDSDTDSFVFIRGNIFDNDPSKTDHAMLISGDNHLMSAAIAASMDTDKDFALVNLHAVEMYMAKREAQGKTSLID